MAATEHEQGDQVATVGTEHVLNTTDPELTDGVFQFVVELGVLVKGDALEMRVFEKIGGTGDTQEQVHLWHFVNAQDDGAWFSPGFILIHGWKYTLKQTTGTSRTFKWSIRKAA